MSPAPGFATDEETFSQTHKFVDERKTFFRIHELCDKKQGIKLTSLLSHNAPRTDCRFIAEAHIFNTNGDAQG